MQFKDIIGQEATKSRFIQTVNDNRVSHAQLIVGEKGVGKLAMAIAFAQYVSCQNKQANDSCGQCASCKKYQKLVHPDLHFVFPVVKSKGASNPVSDTYIGNWRKQVLSNPYFDLNDWYASLGVENAQGMIYSNESSEIIKKLNLKTYESDYKIMIIWLPEKMHAACANKLLKLIEEPPTKTIFFLVSEEPNRILQTIRSRAQMMKIPRIEKDALSRALKSEYNLSDTELNNLVRLSEGSYRKARILIKNSDENAFNFDRFVSIMRICYARNVLELMTWAEEISTIGRERQKSFLQYCLKMIRENFILNLKQEEMVFLNGEEMNFSQRFSPFINEDNVWPIADELTKAYNDIERNGNAKIIFLDLSLRWVKLLRP
ncbi:DNA polymerase III subunit delta [Ancylomarina euxinus]|uniref:DNA polymerase III subunit delta n=1 Tax=Ancylomarina euxinus TaxID=2283627 RepID=A0A425XZW6_9BACT|nr:DNA polymerase III subunit delta [Ancylomarina euxinus]MCZ4695480.1 DNA polymerase III subunit delta [Ancylomarina euxinus]MUP15702.1 DNA polymerase III subunit delta [Ancylomarina euxinus]RRG20731.1 DNA polymerase III subunit delta [Ancylomarina euxinus]